jgi:hypothetical protein
MGAYKQVKRSAPLLNIGANKETVVAARETILAILGSGAEQETLRTALVAFESVCSIKSATITNCVFNGGAA